MTEYIVKETNYLLASRQEVVGVLIRCKDCQYKKRKGVDYFCDHITGEEIMVSPNDYCSWSERETDG